jgi:hypothetical protein
VTTWADVAADAPAFAARVRTIFDAGTNKTMATLRRDGSPRISAIEMSFEADGQVRVGMMPGSMKLLDVRRDPRVAIHAPTLEPDPEGGPGDTKLAGRLVEIPAPPDDAVRGAGYFVLDIAEVVITWVEVAEELLVVETWQPGRGWHERLRR